MSQNITLHIGRVRKADGTYRIVQDLRAIDRLTKDLYPVVANPYSLLAKLEKSQVWFTVLDLKDAFFCLPVAPESQQLFAIEWENANRRRKTQQLTCTVLAQGFKSSPTIFRNQLAWNLEAWKSPSGKGDTCNT